MIHARDRAVREQLAASDPSVSAFVEASAGSGKTKLLTDRILRLMLAGADPARIQCLTFTKAAAAEMALRLQHRLGTWATADDAKLDKELDELRVAPGARNRDEARKLFARVLDLPGGMRIGTIHAFCQSLLRRFPVEAAISPHFQLVEDADARQTMEQVREAVLVASAPDALATLAGLEKAEGFGHLLLCLDNQREHVAPLLSMGEAALTEAVWRASGAEAASEAALLAAAVSWPEEDAMRTALRLSESKGTPAAQTHVRPMLGWLALPPELRVQHWDDWRCGLLNGKGEPRQLSCFANKALATLHPEIAEAVVTEQHRMLRLDDARRAVRTAEATAALLRLALPALRAYAGRKGELGLLDYGDLISRTSDLLRDPGAAWVLYKLDGGIDHLLLDEVQDTAPEQWQVAHLLTDEFFAGVGARLPEGAPARTFFAVGDPKQSIYSFQGADRDEFTRSRARVAYRVAGSGQRWGNVTLDVSFRSTAPVLELVDAVFAQPPASVGVSDGDLQHFADRVGDAGRVELWPLAPVPERPELPPWTVPATNLGLQSAPQLLAQRLAAWVASEIGQAELPSKGRTLEAGDVLILVRRRTDFARDVVRALKARGVPVAGLDRLVLTEQAAVQDLLAACDAVLLPGDDLQVGCVLTSPLGGLTQESLMGLAIGRRSTLLNTLRDRAGERADWAQAWAFLSALGTRADHVTPHALLAEALGPLGGRARLLARLGPEAAEPLDELLGAALDYTRLHPPSLQGFTHWLRRSGATITRQAGGAGGSVRVMTVHGAKGLQAPLVILPDTTALPPDDDKFAWVNDPATATPIPLWAPRKELRCAAVGRARATERARQMQEYNRLLYVALTRPEDRLVICGWQTRKGVPDESWWSSVQRGFHAIGARAEPFDGWVGEILVADCPQTRPPQPGHGAAPSALTPLPAWAGRPGDWRPAPPPAEPALPIPLAPSRPDDAALGPVPAARSPRGAPGSGSQDRFRRGNLIHELLQHLPSLAPERREPAARAHLRRNGLDDAEATTLATQALAVLAHPALQPLFGPAGRAEQPLTGLVGGTIITGKVDRLAVLPDEVLLADYKTGRVAPADPGATPVLYLRQLASYRAVLQSIYPDRPVRCALVWTEGPTVVELPPALLDAHAPAA